MSTLPLFPLSTVLYPGLIMPLHIFEPRYRELIKDLLAALEDPSRGPREFGVVAIRHGRETDTGAVDALYEVGCTATLREVAELPDGRYEITVVGSERFRVLDLGDAAPYLRAEVDGLDEELGETPEFLVGSVKRLFDTYLDLIIGREDDRQIIPDDLITVSYLVAATMALPLPQRQSLLEAPDAATRLRLERDLLNQENALIQVLHTLPATDLTRYGWSRN